MTASLGAQASRLHSVRQHAQRIRYPSTLNDSASLFSRYALTAGGMSTPAGLPRWGPRTPALPAVRSFRARNHALPNGQSLGFSLLRVSRGHRYLILERIFWEGIRWERIRWGRRRPPRKRAEGE